MRIAVRAYELDSHGHVNRAVYLQYAEHARWEYLRAAGIEQADVRAAGVGPVTLEQTIRYHRELRLADDTLVAEVNGVCGVLDLELRRLVRPQEFVRLLARAGWRPDRTAADLPLGVQDVLPVDDS